MRTLVTFGLGALAMYLFDPQHGRGRRGRVRDRLARARRFVSMRANMASVRLTERSASKNAAASSVRGCFSGPVSISSRARHAASASGDLAVRSRLRSLAAARCCGARIGGQPPPSSGDSTS